MRKLGDWLPHHNKDYLSNRGYRNPVEVITHLPIGVVVIVHKQTPQERSCATFVDDGDICSIVVLIR